MDALPIRLWVEQARRDDWHMALDGSDIRQMLSEIIRLQALNDGMLEALESCPLPSSMGTAEEHYRRFYDWHTGVVCPALAKATGAA